MKNRVFALCAAAALCLLCACSQTDSATANTDTVALIADIETTQYFTHDPIAVADVENIVSAGINAPSAMNGQPWHFSVVTDPAVLEQIAGDMSFGGGKPPAGLTPPEGMAPPAGAGAPPAAPAGGTSKAGLTDAPMAVVISCADGSELDAGLACQNMSVTAQLLGYGTKIISSPTMALNGEKQAEYRTLLGIPENQSAAAILLVGHRDTAVDTAADGYTGATARSPVDELVTYIFANN